MSRKVRIEFHWIGDEYIFLRWRARAFSEGYYGYGEAYTKNGAKRKALRDIRRDIEGRPTADPITLDL